MSALSEKFPSAFVTGASAGLGHAFCRMLLGQGVRVWGTARDPSRLDSFRDAPGFTPVALDLADGDAAAAAFERAAQESGSSAADLAKAGFDLVIQNAGFGVFGSFSETPFPVWQTQLEAMVVVTARLSHAAFGQLAARPNGRRGCLVHVSSLAAEFPLPFMAGYNAAKGALSALSESLIFESRGRPVTVIDFRPGDYRTLFNQAVETNSPAMDKGADPRLPQAWRTLRQHCDAGPPADRAAEDLRRALARGRSGIVRSGDFFQARIAPALAALAPASWVRGITSRYYGL